MRPSISKCTAYVSAFCVGVIALGSLIADSSARVYEPDRRHTLSPSEEVTYPWSAVGIVQGAGLCTGTLFGYRIVVTAAHCVSRDGRLDDVRLRFHLVKNKHARRSANVIQVAAGTLDPAREPGRDWALLVLDRRMPEKTFGLYSTQRIEDFFAYNATTWLVGFSGDIEDGLVASFDQDCNIKAAVGGLFQHNCSAMPGSSGGPLFVKEGEVAWIIAVNVAMSIGDCPACGMEAWRQSVAYGDGTSNLAIPTSAFYDLALELRQRYP